MASPDEEMAMLRANNAPVTWSELEEFTTAAVVELDERVGANDALELMLAVDDGARLLSVAGMAGTAGVVVQSAADQLFAVPRRMAAMATMTGWSPSPTEPIVASWLVVAVASGLPVLAGARRVVEDRLWTALNPDELPWYALSSAASLRAALETGEPLAIKSGADGRLFRRPDEEPEPPLDDRGRL